MTDITRRPPAVDLIDGLIRGSDVSGNQIFRLIRDASGETSDALLRERLTRYFELQLTFLTIHWDPAKGDLDSVEADLLVLQEKLGLKGTKLLPQVNRPLFEWYQAHQGELTQAIAGLEARHRPSQPIRRPRSRSRASRQPHKRTLTPA